MPEAIVVHSGGLDSTVLLFEMLEDFNVVASIGMNYGQRHVRELQAADLICERLKIVRYEIDLSTLGMLFESSSQTGWGEVPDGHYTAETMKKTIVPNRNMILLSIAAGFAIDRDIPIVGYGAHSGDHAIYPDCRPEFVETLNKSLLAGNDFKCQVFAPFLELTKTDIVRRGAELGVPFEHTWSCYKGGEKHCGRCGTCVERAEAFALAGVYDPTQYEDANYWRTAK